MSRTRRGGWRGPRGQRGFIMTPFAFAVGGGDPSFSSVVLLLHFDGSNASTTFTDSSSYGHTMTPGGNAQLSTTSPKYGTACGLFDGTGDYVDGPANAVFQVTTADFTVEAWIKPDSAAATRIILSTRPSGTDRGFSFYINSSGKLSFNAWDISGNAMAIVSAGASVSTSAYQHVAVTKSGNVYTLWMDGVADGTVTDATAIGTSGLNLSVARDRTVSGREFHGRIDDLRYTNGVARYSTTFTPPAAAFPDF